MHTYHICLSKNIIDHFVNSGSTVNLCTLDPSKAFDKVNHHALFLKLMQRWVPAVLLTLLETFLLHCYSCVKWGYVWSASFEINFGVYDRVLFYRCFCSPCTWITLVN